MSVKDSVLLHKLKDGIQDTVVFLRMLEQFKIPAVMETRRKKLLEKLLHLQGDTIREGPPSYENGGPASPNREVGELTRRGSVVEDKVNEYARIESKAKEDMVHTSPKKAHTSAAAAAASPPATVEEPEPSEYLEPAAVVQRRSKSTSPERPVSTTSVASSEDAESKKCETEQVDEGIVKESGGKKKRFGHLKGLRNKIGKRSKRTTLPELVVPQQNGNQESGEQAAVETGEGDTTAVAAETQEGEGKVEGEEKEGKVEEGGGEGEGEEVEEGVKIKSELEKRVQKRFGNTFNWVKIWGKLKDTTMTLTTGTKEKQLELVGCMVSPSDAAPNGIELFSHKEQKQWVFRVASEELRKKWVEELQKAIDECPIEPWSPVPPVPPVEEPVEVEEQEKPDEEIPEIKVEPAEGGDETPTKKKRSNFAVSPNRGRKSKSLSEIPDQGIQIKGYVHRKKGTFGGWERAYCVVTFASMYFTTGEEVREYHHVCMLSGTGSVKQEKRGHDRQSESLAIKSGKNKETLSLASSEVQSWKQALENVLGVSQVSLELESEDEEEAVDTMTMTAATTAVPLIEEDQGLYEELPEFGIDEDIYEEFDDVPRVEPDLAMAPSLPPPRQEQRSEPSPALPPRNEISQGTLPSPALPPRTSPIPTTKFPQKGGTVGTNRPPLPPPDVGEEEQYEDIEGPQAGTGGTGGDEGEELYEDIASPQQAQDEELYDDIVGATASPAEDYTEMDMGQGGPPEEYVTMERPQEDEQEVYCEVDSDLPPHAPANSLPLPPKSASKTLGGGAIQKPPPPASYVPKHSGNLSHKGPKKSRFYEEWCVVEGTNLCTYKNQKDKRTVEKISLNEFDMVYTPEKDGKFAFRLTKGDKVHHFSPGSKEELCSWIGALRDLSKSATLELPSGEQQVCEATQDHAADSDEQISFKMGAYIRVISQESADFWVGQLGNNSQVFTGKIGKFPASKVALAEDLYI